MPAARGAQQAWQQQVALVGKGLAGALAQHQPLPRVLLRVVLLMSLA
jgi:hypothetical protein